MSPIVNKALICTLVTARLIHAQQLSELENPINIRRGDTIVIGFLGGWGRWNDDNQSVRKTILKLRQIPRVHAESISNHNRYTALNFITQALDRNNNGRVDVKEAAAARIILFGQSLGGNATVDLARSLEELRIPVLLTIQVDSVGVRDGLIPTNVHEAANYYQHMPLTIWGRSGIRAEDPSLTRIIGNFERKYPMFDPDSTGPNASWARRYMGGGHARMEADEDLWAEVEGLARQAIGSRGSRVARGR